MKNCTSRWAIGVVCLCRYTCLKSGCWIPVGLSGPLPKMISWRGSCPTRAASPLAPCCMQRIVNRLHSCQVGYKSNQCVLSCSLYKCKFAYCNDMPPIALFGFFGLIYTHLDSLAGLVYRHKCGSICLSPLLVPKM